MTPFPPEPATPASASARPRILVWDAPVRVFHWLMVLCFAGAWLSAESERWRLLHVTLGYTLGGLVAFRLVWGLLGTRHARFASFVRGPAAIGRYLRSLWRGRPEHHTGHNPAGALAIVLLLGMSGVLVASGWAQYNELGGEWLEDVHEAAGNLMLLLAGVHVAGVVLASRLHHENLARAMVTGRKYGPPGDAVRRAWGTLAVLMLAAVLAFWALQYRSAPAAGAASASGATAQYPGRDDDD
ncbi:MAG: cytochrome b [Rhodoferax sp.]|nr:cytochrome b [Rhodoferax sp.]